MTGLGTPVANLLVTDLVAYAGPGTTYSGPTVGPLQDATLTDTGSSDSGTINVFSVFDALAVSGGDFAATTDGTPAAGAADRTATTPDLNIPDPADGADSPMAAGFHLASAAGPVAPTGNATAISSSLNPSAVGPMPWTSSSGPWSVVGGQVPSAAVPSGVQAGPQSSLVVQRADEGNEGVRPLSGPHRELMLDAVLADLISDADRWRDGIDGATNEVQPLSGTGDAPDGSGPDGIRSDDARPAPASRPVEVPYLMDGFIARRLRTVPVSDTVLDELAADAAGLRRLTTGGSGGPSLLRSAGASNPPVAGDPIAQGDRPGKPGGVLARLAVTLVAAGFWGYRARNLDVTNRNAGRRP